MKVGDTVEWEDGLIPERRKKSGSIIAAVHKGEDFRRTLRQLQLPMFHRAWGSEKPRNYDSFIVMKPAILPDRPTVYWPDVCKLKLVEEGTK